MIQDTESSCSHGAAKGRPPLLKVSAQSPQHDSSIQGGEAHLQPAALRLLSVLSTSLCRTEGSVMLGDSPFFKATRGPSNSQTVPIPPRFHWTLRELVVGRRGTPRPDLHSSATTAARDSLSGLPLSREAGHPDAR